MSKTGRKNEKDKKTPNPTSTPSKTKKEKEVPKLKFNTVKCKVCKKECLDPDSFNSEDDDSINCEECNHWFHKNCTNTTNAEWESLKGSNENITFRCDDCIANKGQHVNQMQMFQQLLRENNEVLFKRIEGFESKIMLKVDEKIEQKFAEFEDKNEKLIDEKLKAHSKTIEQNKKEKLSLENEIKAHVTQSIDEIKEKEERRNNLIMFNLKESAKEENTEEEKEDLQEILKVSQHTNPELKDTVTNQLTVNNIRRLGKKKTPTSDEDKSTKPRPIKITLPDESTKFKILKKSHKLKDYQENNKIGLKLDLTKQQQMEEKALRQELIKRREQQEDVMIFRGQVIKRADHEKLKKEHSKVTNATQ